MPGNDIQLCKEKEEGREARVWPPALQDFRLGCRHIPPRSSKCKHEPSGWLYFLLPSLFSNHCMPGFARAQVLLSMGEMPSSPIGCILPIYTAIKLRCQKKTWAHGLYTPLYTTNCIRTTYILNWIYAFSMLLFFSFVLHFQNMEQAASNRVISAFSYKANKQNEVQSSISNRDVLRRESWAAPGGT